MLQSRKYFCLAIHTLLLILFAQASAAVYTQPTRRTVLNEVIELAQSESTFPVYFSDAGQYFAEVYLTNEKGDVDNSHTHAISLQVKVDFLRKGELLRSERRTIEFAPGELNKTLFTARAPRDLPQRKKYRSEDCDR